MAALQSVDEQKNKSVMKPIEQPNSPPTQNMAIEKGQLAAIKKDLFFSVLWAAVAIVFELVLYWKWH